MERVKVNCAIVCVVCIVYCPAQRPIEYSYKIGVEKGLAITMWRSQDPLILRRPPSISLFAAANFGEWGS